MEVATGQIFEWRIENFTFWCKDVHGSHIDSPLFSSPHFKHMELYPKGLKGRGERMVVRIRDITSDFSGDLSFIGSNGFLICTQRVKITEKSKTFHDLTSGPKYEGAIADGEKSGDRLTIRFCIRDVQSYEQSMCTHVDVLKVSLTIDEDLIESIESGDSKGISFIPYAQTKDYEGLILKAARTGETVELVFERANKKKNSISVKSCISLLSGDKVFLRYGEKDHIFRDNTSWTFSDSLQRKELVAKGITLLLRLKIINGSVRKSYNHLLYEVKGVSILPNNHDHLSIPDEKSSPKSTDHDAKPNHVISNITDDSSGLAKDFMCLYQDQDFSDLQLNCGNISFPVHRNILSARSPVFKSLLFSDMREAASGAVNIEDLDAPTLARFLAFLYTGSVEDLQVESALKLYYAADKYQVPTLKRKCSDFMQANVSISTVCDILSLADKHQDDQLTSTAHDFILENYNEVLRSEEWRIFMKREPLLVAETVTHFAAKNCVRKHEKI